MQQLRATTKSLRIPPLSIARYSFIQLSQLGRQWRERTCPIFETVTKGDLNPGSLDCESGILPLSYRAPHLVGKGKGKGKGNPSSPSSLFPMGKREPDTFRLRLLLGQYVYVTSRNIFIECCSAWQVNIFG